MPVTVYGSSDDLIEIEGDVSKELMASSPRLLRFNDGTEMVVSYSPVDPAGYDGMWRIDITKVGKATVVIHRATDYEEDYSDKVTLTWARPLRLKAWSNATGMTREELLDAAAEIDFASMTNAQIEAVLALAASNNEDEDDGEDDDWGHMRGRNG